jgi:hypothetical protein
MVSVKDLSSCPQFTLGKTEEKVKDEKMEKMMGE